MMNFLKLNLIKGYNLIGAISVPTNDLVGGGTEADLTRFLNNLMTWIQRIGIVLGGVALLIGFVVYTVSDVDKKQQAKQRIIQTMLGIIGIVVAVTLIKVILGFFR